MYDYIIVTHIPAFYKVNLYKELAKKLKILVVFIASDTNEKRSSDFISLAALTFDYRVLSNGAFQRRSKLKSLTQLVSIIRNNQYRKILLSGWDLPEFWVAAILSPTKKNCLALESTVLESNVDGLKGRMKRIFLSFIATVFASGKLHVELLNKLKYQKEVTITKGVGIINKPTVVKSNKQYQKRFLFVGRLSKVKNLEMLVRLFNDLPGHQLTIVGDGEEKHFLTNIAKDNIIFIEPIENSQLMHEFQKHDMLILPSVSETWGLVVEESLYFGLPVIVSSRCGVSELIMTCKNGYIFSPHNIEELFEIIDHLNEESYRGLVANVNQLALADKDIQQVASYDIA